MSPINITSDEPVTHQTDINEYIPIEDPSNHDQSFHDIQLIALSRWNYLHVSGASVPSWSEYWRSYQIEYAEVINANRLLSLTSQANTIAHSSDHEDAEWDSDDLPELEYDGQ